jgi:hypothetical protein
MRRYAWTSPGLASHYLLRQELKYETIGHEVVLGTSKAIILQGLKTSTS